MNVANKINVLYKFYLLKLQDLELLLEMLKFAETDRYVLNESGEIVNPELSESVLEMLNSMLIKNSKINIVKTRFPNKNIITDEEIKEELNKVFREMISYLNEQGLECLANLFLIEKI